ncbi:MULTISPECIES: hypothetical protein [unclassified Nonomuraea]|uniref:hypothetical protein n=1 Tax=unclassified Nonomuraea TaxID=2593643 RepID=UPI0035C12DCC
MQHVMLGSLRGSPIGLSAIAMADPRTSGGGLDDTATIRTIHPALDLLLPHTDTAETYGPFHSEEIAA